VISSALKALAQFRQQFRNAAMSDLIFAASSLPASSPPPPLVYGTGTLAFTYWAAPPPQVPSTPIGAGTSTSASSILVPVTAETPTTVDLYAGIAGGVEPEPLQLEPEPDTPQYPALSQGVEPRLRVVEVAKNLTK
jgi:hypothetical protein